MLHLPLSCETRACPETGMAPLPSVGVTVLCCLPCGSVVFVIIIFIVIIIIVIATSTTTAISLDTAFAWQKL